MISVRSFKPLTYPTLAPVGLKTASSFAPLSFEFQTETTRISHYLFAFHLQFLTGEESVVETVSGAQSNLFFFRSNKRAEATNFGHASKKGEPVGASWALRIQTTEEVLLSFVISKRSDSLAIFIRCFPALYLNFYQRKFSRFILWMHFLPSIHWISVPFRRCRRCKGLQRSAKICNLKTVNRFFQPDRFGQTLSNAMDHAVWTW